MPTHFYRSLDSPNGSACSRSVFLYVCPLPFQKLSVSLQRETETTHTMKAYKGFERHDDGTLWCQDFQYDVGKTYKHEGKIELCVTGFHACHELHQVWQFYPNNGTNVFYEVECGGEIIESEENDGKFVCSEITLVREIDMSDVEKFGYACLFHEGFAVVILNEKYNFINTSGKLLSELWYNDAWGFREGFAPVKLNGKFNFIDTEGKLLSEQWYDWVDDFREGFALVELNEKYNHIDTKGNLLSEQWYDSAGPFYGGFAQVVFNGKCNFINKEGKLLSEQWFDDAYNFSEGLAAVKLNDKWNFIDTSCNLLSEQWYDKVCFFSGGFAQVKLNGKWYIINTKAIIVSK